MKKMIAIVFMVSLALGVTACGEADELRRQVQDLETERGTLQAEVETLKAENEEFKTKIQELEEQVALAAAPLDTRPVVPSVPATPTAPKH